MQNTLKTDPDRPKQTWTGRYKSIPYEICKWYFNIERLKWMWNYYITLNPERIANTDQRDTILLERKGSSFSDKQYYPTHNIDVNTDIKFHRGCTYYELIDSPKPDTKMVKIGCDYGHYMDREPYLDRVLSDVQMTIDSFYDWVDTYLRRCRGCGEYFEPGTGIKNEKEWETKCGNNSKYCQ